jgi:parallel beta-helix repeat protein
VFPGESIQAVVDANPSGTTFYLRAGVHSGQSIKPRDGDKFIGEPGTILSGEDRIEFAFRSGAANVTIQNLTIEKYANPVKTGAIEGNGKAWRIVNNEIRYNWGGGVTLNDRYQLIGNNIHHNRQIGIKGSGTDVLIENNEIAFNNYNNDYDPNWEAGGAKFLRTVNLVVRGNYVHDNNGSGLWTDWDNIGTLYENNVVVNNTGPGIHHEASYDATIRNNKVEGNGKVGIRIASSSNVEIYGNTLKNNNGGIYLSQKNRGSGSYGTFEIANVWVHDNTISFNQGINGLRVHDGGDIYYTGKNNRFDRNTYALGEAEPFFWMGDKRTPQEWTSYGQDQNGTIN